MNPNTNIERGLDMNADAIIKKWENEAFPSLRDQNKAKVDEYTEKLRQGVTFPPILIATFPKDETYGEHAILDGKHRLGAYLKVGGTVPYEIKNFPTVADALTFAYVANMAHGLPVAEGSRNKRLRLLKKMGKKLEELMDIFKLSKASIYDICKEDSQRGEKSGRKKGTKVSRSAAHKSLGALEEKPFFKYLGRVEESLGAKSTFNKLVAWMTPPTDKEGGKIKLDASLVKMCKSVQAGLAQLVGSAESEVKGS